jgi:Tfp pilus assembly protein PilO
MTGRDRIVLMVVVVAVFLVGGWMLLVSPKRKEAKAVEEKVTTAQRELTTAESQLSDARAAQAQYSTAYAAVVNLGKAVPASQEVASLVYQLEEASNLRDVSFNSIVSGASGSASSSSSSSSASSATTVASGSGFTQMPFTFIFSGGFFSLEHLFRQLTAFTVPKGSEGLRVSGRLLTIQSVKLTPEAVQGKKGSLQGTVTATAYVLPPGQTVTSGATPSSPTGAAPATGSSSSPTTPAIARVAP